MALIFVSYWADLLLCVVFLLALIYIYTQYRFGYWKRKGIITIDAKFPFGHLTPAFTGTEHLGFLFKKIYDVTKHRPFAGLFFVYKKCILINDPDLIKTVLVKDFQSFSDHGLGLSPVNDPLQKSLFRMNGAPWKTLRTKISPTFTSNKIKRMFSTIVSVADGLNEYMLKEIDSNDVFEFKEVMAKFGTDVIGSCAFGIDSNSFLDPNARFRCMGRKAQDNRFVKVMYDLFAMISPELLVKFKVKISYEDVEEFFMTTVKETMRYRKENNLVRNDLIQMLIDLHYHDKETGADDAFSVEDIAAQAFFFFIAGFDTSSSAISFALYELALNQHIQDRLRKEIDEVLEKHERNVTSESVAEMSYLTQVLEETLRIYPSAPMLIRQCEIDYQMPGTDLLIQRGTKVMVPMLGIHRDPEYFPEPMRFDPERFSPENKSTIRPFSYFPFGEGPRVCLGARFAMMQLRIAIVTIVSNFRLSPCKKTLIPMEYEKRGIFLAAKGGLFLKVERRED